MSLQSRKGKRKKVIIEDEESLPATLVLAHPEPQQPPSIDAAAEATEDVPSRGDNRCKSTVSDDDEDTVIDVTTTSNKLKKARTTLTKANEHETPQKASQEASSASGAIGSQHHAT